MFSKIKHSFSAAFKRLELLPDELGLSLSLFSCSLKIFVCDQESSMCSCSFFVTPECGSIVWKSLSQVITTLITCLMRSRYLGRICQYRYSRPANYTTVLHSLPAINQRFQVIWDLHYDSHNDSLPRRWCYI